ncbi:MAG: hypothetical protein JWQ40_1701 [Segetibacter sp.]|nr:hypothetical protein [Segetibacter sp.]
MLAELAKLKTGFLTHVIFPSAYGSIFFEPNCIATILHRCHARLYCNLCFGLAVLAPGRVEGYPELAEGSQTCTLSTICSNRL